jgi:hypothetical protein
VQLGVENRKKTMWAAALGVLAVALFAYEVFPMFWGSSATTAASSPLAAPAATTTSKPANQRRGPGSGKKGRPAESLDPTLQLQLLATSEQIKYEGSGRNIFVSQADPVIPQPKAPGQTDVAEQKAYVAPPIPPPPPIPLKFFGFANQSGEAKKVFLSKGEDVFIAAEGDIVDRRYKVVRISPTSVEIQDVVGSGPPQNIPLTQG